MSENLASFLVVMIWTSIAFEVPWIVTKLIESKIKIWLVIGLAVFHLVLASAWRMRLSIIIFEMVK